MAGCLISLIGVLHYSSLKIIIIQDVLNIGLKTKLSLRLQLKIKLYKIIDILSKMTRSKLL